MRTLVRPLLAALAVAMLASSPVLAQPGTNLDQYLLFADDELVHAETHAYSRRLGRFGQPAHDEHARRVLVHELRDLAGDVAVGDVLLGADGRPTRVVAVTDVMLGRPCYEVRFCDGTVIIADAEQVNADVMSLVVAESRVDVLHPELIAPETRAALPWRVRLARVSIERFELRLEDERHIFTELQFSHAALGPRLVSAAGTFTRPDPRYPATVRLDLTGTPQELAATLATSIDGVPVQAKLTIAPAASPALRQIEVRAGPVDLARLSGLTFEEPDTQAFPCLQFGWRVAREGGLAGTALNAANEVAVDAFLQGRLPFLSIHDLVADALDRLDNVQDPDLGLIEETDRAVRRHASARLPQPAS